MIRVILEQNQWKQLKVVAQRPCHKDAILDPKAMEHLIKVGLVETQGEWTYLTRRGVELCTKINFLRK